MSPNDEFAGASAADSSGFKGLVTPVGFESPSKNITCGFWEEGGRYDHVICQINDFTFESPRNDCNGAGSGGAIELKNSGKPSFACLGDVEGGGPALPCGSQITAGGLSCVSLTDGVTCHNDGGYGFMLAKDKFDLS